MGFGVMDVIAVVASVVTVMGVGERSHSTQVARLERGKSRDDRTGATGKDASDWHLSHLQGESQHRLCPAQKKVAALPPLEETLLAHQGHAEVVIDELWSFVLAKRHAVWMWIALSRRNRWMTVWLERDFVRAQERHCLGGCSCGEGLDPGHRNVDRIKPG